MRQIEKGEKSPACGYGLLGLCCSACLFGPCRISPFEKDSEKGLCGDASDLMVAKNLFRVVTGEALEGLRCLKEAAESLAIHHLAKASKRRISDEKQKGLIEKYGLLSHITGKALSRHLSKEVERLLSPSSQGQNPVLKKIFPEKSFPSLYQYPFPPGSLTGFLLDSMKIGSAESSDIKEILRQCLQISLITIVCDGLREDVNDIIGEEGLSRRDEQVLDALKSLSSDLSPVMLLLEDERIPSKEWVYQMAQELEKLSEGKVLTLSLRGIGSLPEVGRRLSEKWVLPIGGMRIVVLISSPSATWTLGALTLGFTVISTPALPIHGSERVEKFFSEDLKKRFGNIYFPTWREDLLNAALEFLRWKD